MKKSCHIINWLTMMRDDGHFNILIHKMNAKNWYNAYKQANLGNDAALYEDEKYFNLHMTKISNLHLFEGFYKTVVRTLKYKFFTKLDRPMQMIGRKTMKTPQPMINLVTNPIRVSYILPLTTNSLFLT